MTVTLTEDGSGQYRAVFAASACPSYALVYAPADILAHSAGEQCRVEPASERASRGLRPDPWRWSAAHLPIGGGECRRDEECQGGASRPDDIASEPVRDLCEYSWYDWYEVERAWIGSAGTCIEGHRCRANVECPAGFYCDVYERVIDGVAGTLQQARCRFGKPDRSLPTDCTTATRDCPERKVEWL